MPRRNMWEVGEDDIAVRVVSVIAFLVQVSINATYSGDIGNVSDTYPTCITPSNWTFAIWTLIYLEEAWYNFMLVWSPMGTDFSLIHHEVGWLYPLLCVVNIAWVLTWRIGTPPAVVASTVLIVIMLALLLTILVRVESWSIMPRVPYSNQFVWRADFWVVISIDIPLSIYFGWMLCASILGISTSIVAMDPEWTGGPLNPVQWTTTLTIAATVIAGFWAILKRNPVIPLVVAWACFGIASNGCASMLGVTIVGCINIIWFGIAMGRFFRGSAPPIGFRTAYRAKYNRSKWLPSFQNSRWVPSFLSPSSAVTAVNMEMVAS